MIYDMICNFVYKGICPDLIPSDLIGLELSKFKLVFFVALVISLALTPVSMFVARKFGFMDVPEDGRRMHSDAMPRLGGMAIAIAVLVTLYAYAVHYRGVQPILIGGALIFVLGAIDDKFKLPAWLKLVAEVAVASLMYHMGIKIQFVQNFFGSGIVQFDETLVFLVTVIWIVGITNAINLIDGLDGLAAGTVAINSACLAYIMVNEGTASGRAATILGLMALAGACLGFLPFNFSPAKTFMGDGGSLFLGFMVATISTVGKLKGASVMTMIIPIFVLALPLFDTAFAIIRRVIKRQPIMEADKRHLHHVLIESGYGHKRAVIMLYGISGIMGVAAILTAQDMKLESAILFLVAFLYIYVFLTDPNHVSEGKKEKKKKKKNK